MEVNKKKYLGIAGSILAIALFSAFIIIALRNNARSFKGQFYGRIIGITKGTKGFYSLQLEAEGNQTFCITYSGFEGMLDVEMGDSLYKMEYSNLIFRKVFKTGVIEKLTKASYNIRNCE